LLARDGHSGKSASFHEGLITELRSALAKASAQAAERANELVKLKAEMKALLIDQTAAAQREHELMSRLHLLSTQQQSAQMNVSLAQQAYSRAEALCASLERQLRAAHQQLLLTSSSTSGGEHKDGSLTERSHSRPAEVPSIDYAVYSDLQPSPLLRAVLQQTNAKRASQEDSTQSLSAYTGSTATLLGSEEAKTLQQHGRAGRVSLGRPQRAGAAATVLASSPNHAAKGSDGFSSSGSLGLDARVSGHSAIASTISMVSSSASSATVGLSPATRSQAASAALLTHQPHYQYRAGGLSASTAALDAQASPSARQSFADLPIAIKPSGGAR